MWGIVWVAVSLGGIIVGGLMVLVYCFMLYYIVLYCADCGYRIFDWVCAVCGNNVGSRGEISWFYKDTAVWSMEDK